MPPLPSRDGSQRRQPRRVGPQCSSFAGRGSAHSAELVAQSKYLRVLLGPDDLEVSARLRRKVADALAGPLMPQRLHALVTRRV